MWISRGETRGGAVLGIIHNKNKNKKRKYNNPILRTWCITVVVVILPRYVRNEVQEHLVVSHSSSTKMNESLTV